MKSVLISIKPKWCELIASSEKTVEVRKTRPKLKPPFKCYIYCTKPKKILRYVWGKEDYAGYGEPYTQMRDDEKVFCKIPDGSSPFCSNPYSSKVIGEFVCDDILCRTVGNFIVKEDAEKALKGSCVTEEELYKYLRWRIGTPRYEQKRTFFYAWHISDLKIYDEPRRVFYREYVYISR